MVERRYQVFVSSTFKDLIEERQEILQALLELDCIPCGMELFPAANEDQWTLIKKVIDDCDYYIVVIGGKYGSLGPQGISYTEMEYRYAVEIQKPVIAFIYKDLTKLPYDRVEGDPEIRDKLAKFCELVQKKMVKYWDSAANLGSVVSRSLIQLIKTHPATGWVRADNLPDESAAQEILKLRKEIDRLHAESNIRVTQKPAGTENLAQGSDTIELKCTVVFRNADDRSWNKTRGNWRAIVSINELIAATAPCMIDEAERTAIVERINSILAENEFPKIAAIPKYRDIKLIAFELPDTSFDTYLVQMIALGIIEKSIRNRSLKDQGTYWHLTPYGEKLMYSLRAITKDSINIETMSSDEELSDSTEEENL